MRPAPTPLLRAPVRGRQCAGAASCTRAGVGAARAGCGAGHRRGGGGGGGGKCEPPSPSRREPRQALTAARRLVTWRVAPSQRTPSPE
eukprot:scaffold1054_cov366-Prasinococcus_capsulatus_cf.AAC.6